MAVTKLAKLREVVERVSIDVIDHRTTAGHTKNKTVHEDRRLAAAIANSISASAQRPCVLRNQLKIFVINQSYRSSFGDFDFHTTSEATSWL